MQTRKLQDGRTVEAFDDSQTLTVYTKCPEKWKLIDMETGEEYQGQHPNNPSKMSWKKIDGSKD